MKPWQALQRFCSAVRCFVGKYLRTALMEFHVDGCNFAKKWISIGDGQFLYSHPGAKAALVRVERRRHSACSMEEGLDGANPCGVLCTGIE